MPTLLLTLIAPAAAAVGALVTKRIWLKMAVPILTAAILAASALANTIWSPTLWSIVGALILSAIGDHFLSNMSDENDYFIRGIALYGLAHVGYLAAALFNAGINLLVLGVLGVVLIGYFFLVLAPAITERALSVAVLIYILLSCATMAAAVTMVWPSPSPLLYSIGIGLILFSDLMISLHEFKRVRGAHHLILPTYYVAHLSIGASVLLLLV
ncbi:MAG: lysoplasmalogenase family protein [Spirochaetales bacterium]